MACTTNDDIRSARDMLDQLGWHEWLAHTNFSFLTGASHPHEMIGRAFDFGYRGITIADFDGAYGLARSHRAWQQLQRQQTPKRIPKLCHGAEIHFAPDHHLPVMLQDTVALVARNRLGYGNLCTLLSRAHRELKVGAFLPWSEFRESVGALRDGLIAIVPMRGLIRRSAMAGNINASWQDVEERLRSLREIFDDDLYVAISRHFHPAEDVWARSMIHMANAFGIKCLPCQDAFFHHPGRKPLSDVLHAIRHNKVLDDCVEQMFVNAERSLHDHENIARRFADLPDFRRCLEFSAELSDQCMFSLDELRYRYPEEMIPPGFTAQTYLESITWQAARKCYGDPLPSRIADLLAHELRLIADLKFADYFLTVWDIVRWARERNILCQGRGSAANSAVCFVLGVTAVDPGMFDLLFERFISVERGDPPDIDVDFEHERREEVIQYIYSRYGRARAAMVANVITFRSRGAARAVGKALGKPDSVLVDAREHMAGDPLWSTLVEEIRGFPRHLGIHSGGFMLSNDPLDQVVPQEPATMPGRSVVQWCKEDIEALGFFKIDILALGMLTAVQKCFSAIKQHYGVELSLDRVPQEDPATYAMIQRADTVGTFQIESRAQMSMLPRLRPRTFYDLVIEIAIIRPGPIQGGMIHPYLRRRNGEDPVVFPDDRLRPILARTLGIPIFQEQVMRIAIAVGDFSAGEANELRRHMGAWTIKGNINPWLDRLAVGMRKNGISNEFIKVILAQMKGFAEYGFPESHSASFAIIAYVSAWLKCHYPAAFFASILNSQPMGFYSPMALVQAARRSGVEVLPVSLQKSFWDHRLELLESAEVETGKPVRYGIRLGMRIVRGLQADSARRLLSVRPDNGWADLDDFYREAARVRVYRSDIASLAMADAFSDFGLSRRDAFWMAEADPGWDLMEDPEAAVNFLDEESMEKVQRDLHATSVSLGEHPTTIVRRDYWYFPVPLDRVPDSRMIDTMSSGQRVFAFGMVLVKQMPPSANGMVFYTLEDDHGYINLAFTPSCWDRYEKKLAGQSFICVSGKFQGKQQGSSILVDRVYEPQLPEGEVVPLPRTKRRNMRYNQCNQPESREKTWISVT